MRKWFLLAVLGLGCGSHRPMSDFPKDTVDPAPTLAAQLDNLERECAGHNGYARFGLCETADAKPFVWFERSGVTHRSTVAYDARSGDRLWIENESWSDVAICLPRARQTFGHEPVCHPMFQNACNGLAEIRAWVEKETRP